MKCKCCNKEIQDDWVANSPAYNGMCFDCHFWNTHLQKDKERNQYEYAIIDGRHYILCKSIQDKSCSGYYGYKFKIRFKDGYVTECDNLWQQGQIPDNFRDLMPDNAEFIR